jgi:hypothetical protein
MFNTGMNSGGVMLITDFLGIKNSKGEHTA